MLNFKLEIHKKPRECVARLFLLVKTAVTKHQPCPDQASAPDTLPPDLLLADVVEKPIDSIYPEKCPITITKQQQPKSFHKQRQSPPPPPPSTPAISIPDFDPSLSVPDDLYFLDKPLPRHRWGAPNPYSNVESTQSMVEFDQLVHETLIYFATAPMRTSNLCNNETSHPCGLIEKLKWRVLGFSQHEPSLLKLAGDVLSYVHETPPFTPECQHLEHRLKAFLQIYE
ncbi:hypothetical protein [Absidia glauca]|uniref:Uncharacterized protein n=1 Tax=Absidia glauca TaxID=4829 RepID=A0A168P0W4_ABSGL|nr:hypothetical protein [Absidia glauca]